MCSIISELEKNIIESTFETNIESIDSIDELYLFHYKNCTIDTPSEEKKYRGLVKDKDGKVICKSFGFTPELNETEEDTIKSILTPSFLESAKCVPSYEGTLLRVFYFIDTGKWYISTCRKLNAFKSKWGGSKSFGSLFVECLNGIEKTDDEEVDFQNWCNENLDKNNCYCYYLRTYVENRIVCSAYDTPTLFCIGWYSDDFEKFNIASDLETVEFTSLDESMKNVDINKSQGLLFITNTGETVKILKKEYVELLKLRGNQPSILYRYIELQQTSDAEEVQKFVNLYQDHFEEICKFTDALEDIIGNIYRKYRNRFVRKLVSVAPPEQYYVIRELHEHFLKDRNLNIITPDYVNNYVKTLPPLRLLGLYKAYEKREKEYGKGNKVSSEHKEKVEKLIL